jgi:solute carrier family 25 (mitochondrial citrate transporter), member 1
LNAGGVVGAIEISCTYPTEYLKTVLQIDKSKFNLGMVGLAKETYKSNGMLGFYRGYTALLIFSMPKNSVRFAGFEFAKTNIFTGNNQMNTFGCGLIAGFSEAVLVVTPQETLKTKLIHDRLSPTPQYKNIFSGIYTIASQTGVRGLYQGVVPTIMKQSSNQAVRFVVFADTKKYLATYMTNKVAVDFIAGGFAGFCSVMANNPVDVIKTKMQQKDALGKSFMSQASEIYAQRGFMGYYSGVVPRLARVVLDAALTFSIFHSLKRNVAEYLAKR